MVTNREILFTSVWMFIRQYCPIRCGIRLTLHLLCSGFFTRAGIVAENLLLYCPHREVYLACEVWLCQTLPNEPLVEHGIPSGVQTQSNLATQSASLCGQSNLLCTRLCERQDNDEARPQRVRVGGLVYSTYDFWLRIHKLGKLLMVEELNFISGVELRSR